jgi:hypothetical protein
MRTDGEEAMPSEQLHVKGVRLETFFWEVTDQRVFVGVEFEEGNTGSPVRK